MFRQATVAVGAALIFTASYLSVASAIVRFRVIGAGLTAIPTNIPANTTILDLWNNAIQTAYSFPFLPSLILLNLGTNLLVEFPNLTFASNTLQALTLSHNHIRIVNPTWASLVALTDLYFDYNDLQEFPDIRQMASLKTLNLNHNNISWIAPPILASLTNLTNLFLADNRLASLPDVELPMFHLLNIDVNPPLTELPILWKLGPAIICLVVGPTGIAPEAFRVMGRLNYLELNSTSPVHVDSVARGCPWLKRLNVVSKNLTELPAEVFVLLTDLRSIDVEQSRLESIPEIPNGTLGLSLSLSDLSGVTLREWAGAQPMHKARYVNDEGDCLLLSITTTFSRLLLEDCAVRCTEDVACSAFSYNFGSNMCGLVQLGAKMVTGASTFGTVFQWY